MNKWLKLIATSAIVVAAAEVSSTLAPAKTGSFGQLFAKVGGGVGGLVLVSKFFGGKK